jgi:hypothetical protein
MTYGVWRLVRRDATAASPGDIPADVE